MELREGLPSNMLYADGASTMRNFVVVLAWHGGSPRVSTSCTDPRDSTLSPENPLKWAFTGSSFSLSMPIFSNSDEKMMLVELPLSIKRPCGLFYWPRRPLLLVGHHGGISSLPSQRPRRLWWYPIEGAWTRPVPLVSSLI